MVDLRVKDLLPLVQKVLDLPVPFVSHYAKAELFLLWSLSLREPRIIWDTHLAERALHLGTCPLRARSRAAESQEEAVGLKQQADAVASQSLSLDSTAARYGIAIIRHGSKHALQSSFLTKPFDEPLTQLEAEYCAEDAQITAEIRAPQRVACDRAGISETLDRVVMPWNVTAAEIQWTGVLYDRGKCRTFLDASTVARDRIALELQSHGITKSGKQGSAEQSAQGPWARPPLPQDETGTGTNPRPGPEGSRTPSSRDLAGPPLEEGRPTCRRPGGPGPDHGCRWPGPQRLHGTGGRLGPDPIPSA